MTVVNYSYGSGSDLIRIKTASGTDAPKRDRDNTYACSIEHTSRSMCSKYEVMYGNVWWYPGVRRYIIGSNTLPRSPTANQNLAVLGELADQIRGHSFNASVFAGELPQTLATVTNTVQAVTGALRSTLKGDLAGAAKHLGFVAGQRQKKQFRRRVKTGDISGAWLSIQYGWKPLLSDTYEAMKAIEAKCAKRFTVFRASKTEKFSGEGAYEPNLYSVPYVNVVTVKMKVTLFEQPSMARTLGLINPLSLLWEKLPWSFVLDWFVPIGSYLDSLSFFSGLDAKCCTTTYSKISMRYYNPLGYIPISAQSRWVGGSYDCQRVSMSRSVGSITIPRPNVAQLEKAFSLGHIKNAAALIHQSISGFKH